MACYFTGSPGTRFPESLTLNTSNNSGSLTGRLSSLSCHSGGVEGSQGTATPKEGSDDDDDSSDWDSWDDEDEVTFIIRLILPNVVVRIKFNVWLNVFQVVCFAQLQTV